MLFCFLVVSAQALTLRGLRHKFVALQQHKNASNVTAMDWSTYTSKYCAEFCKMKGATEGRCTVCEQRLNFSVAEGHVACAVECQGVQTDEVTESVVDCEKRLDECMYKRIEPANCRLECGIPGASPTCRDECHAFKTAARADGNYFATFFGHNYVSVSSMENVTKEVEENGTMVNKTVEEEVVTEEVHGVESLPTIGPGERLPPVKADFRFHVNESAWLAHAHDYCSEFFCNFDTVDSYLCVECPNRLNMSVEHSLMACRVKCEMQHTDEAGANNSVTCEPGCMTTAFEDATCGLECEMQLGQTWTRAPGDTCHADCIAQKASQRANGKTAGAESNVVPYFWPDPPKPKGNATNSSNASNSS